MSLVLCTISGSFVTDPNPYESVPDPNLYLEYDPASVADPGCLSRIPDPDFYPSRIPDPGSRIPDPKTGTKERGEKKLVVIPFYVATKKKFHNIVNSFSFEVLKKKIWANFQIIIELFTKKIVKKLLKIWSWDPGSRIQGSKSTRSRIPDPDPQHWIRHHHIFKFQFYIHLNYSQLELLLMLG